ncbi:hypothetical protein [Trichormus variabilis]|uniref:Uncharacterized protein n=1 Tax=Trichormus variabilis SAG 1403-4b TaxID=447716 RepID=A0A3S1IE90_ANAVA|nr:hypothetical protein [Trichormus variabilis]MBD2626349.1 hypothetical protein [Trichormus variabilis FACHB-164]RUS96115.1 hypothetical protein DSM107003_27770 [Trichormus variabilis SAG 1403-4b]
MKRYMPLILIGCLLFVAGGDRVFTGSLGQASTHTRLAMNKFFIGLFPSWRPKTDPYARTEKQLRETEEKK